MEREQLKKKIAFLELYIKNDKNLIKYLKEQIELMTHDLNSTVADSNSKKRLLARYKDELAEVEKNAW